MKKTILIPTDFTIESLSLVKALLYLQENDTDVYDIILLHGVYLSDAINDLLFFSKGKIMASLTNDEFEEACLIIKNKFASQISSLRKDIFTGFTQTAFNNYAVANKIDKACIPAVYRPKFSSKKSFDLLPYIKKSKFPVDVVELNVKVELPEKGAVAELFYSSMPVG